MCIGVIVIAIFLRSNFTWDLSRVLYRLTATGSASGEAKDPLLLSIKKSYEFRRLCLQNLIKDLFYAHRIDLLQILKISAKKR